MKRFLILLILVQFVTQTFSLDLSIVRGINLKNAMIYAALLLMLIQMAMDGRFKLELPALHACFFMLIAYGITSYLIMILVVKSPEYDAIAAAISLKSQLIDYLVVFLAFFYGVKTRKDALDVTKAILVGIVFANVVTVLDASGILGLNIIPIRQGVEAGRVQGALGEANQYAAIIVMLLPATIAMISMTRGLQKLFWIGGVFASVAALLMTISRGAMVGLVVGAVVGALLLKQFVSPSRILKWSAVMLVVFAIGLILLSAQYGYLMYERLIVSTFMSDGVDATSGRNAIWAVALGYMARAPWTFLTGYGFSSYIFMPFEYATHNEYIAFWFELGLPGVLSFIAIHIQSIYNGRKAAIVAPPEVRPFMIAFVIGWIAVCISIFFVNLFEPYIYVWAYLGISMRMAVSLIAESRDRSTGADERRTLHAPTEPAPVGWVARPRITATRMQGWRS